METLQSPDRNERNARSFQSVFAAFISGFAKVLAVLFVLLFLACIAVPPMGGGIRFPRQSSCMQSAHALGLAMYSYANDNSQNYPDGKSSTEVCQQLLDGGYVTDPSIFYIPAPGKTKALPGQKLKPENVCWDVTGGLSSSGPGDLPVLFLTGYRVSYTPGGAAIPIAKARVLGERTWGEWWRGEPVPSDIYQAGAGVFYVNNSAKWANRVTATDGTSSIPNFISPDYKPDGKTYRQLTPDGVLAP
jgi:type II secretory pathway pseudopilin PulG